jgi:hypothetical protein
MAETGGAKRRKDAEAHEPSKKLKKDKSKAVEDGAERGTMAAAGGGAATADGGGDAHNATRKKRVPNPRIRKKLKLARAEAVDPLEAARREEQRKRRVRLLLVGCALLWRAGESSARDDFLLHGAIH